MFNIFISRSEPADLSFSGHMMEYNRLRMRPYLKHQPECTMRTTNSYLINLISRSGGLSTS